MLFFSLTLSLLPAATPLLRYFAMAIDALMSLLPMPLRARHAARHDAAGLRHDERHAIFLMPLLLIFIISPATPPATLIADTFSFCRHYAAYDIIAILLPFATY
jgi:hypothetical protein